ncbi:hypothetical protein EJ110_NYTH29750 [Nymphaea thermarum]|nr:hypothetical protein EJ110_NYTH29750 [Nymphaea thermarum]
MAVAIPFFQQLTGINVIMFYAPLLFKTIGFGSNASLVSTVITGGVNVVATLVSIYSVDKYGRRFLFLVGGIKMFICQGSVCVLIFFLQVIIGIILGHKFGLSGKGTLSQSEVDLVVPLGWLEPSEIFPLEICSTGQRFNVSVNLLFLIAITQAFGLFFFFDGWVLSMTSFIFFLLPEKKNIPIEEMTLVWRKHWFWKRILLADDGEVEMEKPTTVK